MPAAQIYRRLWRLARRFPRPSQRQVRRPWMALVGGVVLLAGILMIALPGPALIVIPLGLILLATEFKGVRGWIRMLRKFRFGRAGQQIDTRRN